MPYLILINNTPHNEQSTIAFDRAIALALNAELNGQIIQVCPECFQSDGVIKYGSVRLANGDRSQRYLCTRCDRSWREDRQVGGRKRILSDRVLSNAEKKRRQWEKKKSKENGGK
jgi:transposase-like protein